MKRYFAGTSIFLIKSFKSKLTSDIYSTMLVFKLTIKIWVYLLNLSINLYRLVSFERRSTGDKYVQNDTNWPDITGLIIESLEYFGGNIIWLNKIINTVPTILLPSAAKIYYPIFLTHWKDKSKSMSFRIGVLFSAVGYRIRKFYGFKSRCDIFFSWQ